jgi:uncharacterized protein YjbI with pentapeptide repeats
VAKCAYRGEKIREIEEKWIDENIEDKEERRWERLILYEILKVFEGRADCRFDAIPGREFCIFHDPDYWREHPDEVREEFLKHLKEDEKKLFIGFHLPDIKLPKVVEKELHMELAKLHGTLEAIETTFKGRASFDGAKFKGLTFFETTFKGRASFDGARFKGLAWFFEAKFKGRASFDGARFEEAWFIGATFKGRASFDGARFEEAWFIGATFKGEARFVNLIMEGSAYAVFRSSVFEKPHLVSLKGTEIMRLLFLSTEIEKISLTNANLGGEILMVHELLKNPRSDVGFTFDDVIETYGRLRGNLERNHRFSDAGRFFRGEMEARRTRKYYEFLREHEGHAATFMRRISFNIRKGFLWVYVNFLSPYAIYKALAEYGESVWRPLLCSLATIFSMSLFFTFLQGGQVSPQSLLNALGKSISLFFQLAPVDYAALPSIPPMLELLERILGLLLPGLEVIALKRMLERHP